MARLHQRRGAARRCHRRALVSASRSSCSASRCSSRCSRSASTSTSPRALARTCRGPPAASRSRSSASPSACPGCRSTWRSPVRRSDCRRSRCRARRKRRAEAAARCSRRRSAAFAPLYIGLPLGLLAATRWTLGREAALLLIVTVAISDTLQYYSGRTFGRHLLAPVVSPKKTDRRRDRRIRRSRAQPRGDRPLVASADGPAGAHHSRARGRRGRHRRRSVRVAAEAQRRHEGRVCDDSRPRRRARSHRRAAVRRARVSTSSSGTASDETTRHSRIDGIDRAERARRRARASGPAEGRRRSRPDRTRERLREQAEEFGATITALASETGSEGLIAVATHPDVDIVICASSGTAALEAVLAAIDAGKTIALANKEVLVMAGALVTAAARARGVAILPVDSEHNAIHQCLHGRRREESAAHHPDRVGRPVPRDAGRRRSRTSSPKTRCGIRRGGWAGRSRSTRRR